MGCGAVLLGLAILAVGLEAAGYDAASALPLSGPARSLLVRLHVGHSGRSVPLILIGLGIAIAFRAGAFNIGAEGQFYAGQLRLPG